MQPFQVTIGRDEKKLSLDVVDIDSSSSDCDEKFQNHIIKNNTWKQKVNTSCLKGSDSHLM